MKRTEAEVDKLFSVYNAEIKRLRTKTIRDEKFLDTMCRAWDTIEADQDAEIERLKARIATLEESVEASSDADQARAMAKAENDEWRERELSEDFYRKMESGEVF
jgi:hypothetical protein